MEPSDTKCASRDNNSSVHTIGLQKWETRKRIKKCIFQQWNFQCTNHACKYIIDISINFQRLSLNFVYESVNFQKVLKGNITKKYELVITRSTMKQVCEEENLTHQKMVFPGAFGLVNL